jgi:hypothetical protein
MKNAAHRFLHGHGWEGEKWQLDVCVVVCRKKSRKKERKAESTRESGRKKDEKKRDLWNIFFLTFFRLLKMESVYTHPSERAKANEREREDDGRVQDRDKY